MIVVIADDLSGAAELANAAVAAGFSAEVQTGTPARPFALTVSTADVVCLDTDTRRLVPEKAGEAAGEIARGVAAIHPALVYKKCDSVLRGAVAAESLAIARALGRNRVLLVPANPSRNRVIRGGEYFVDGVPLAQTPFANDLDHPRRSSLVAELLGPAPGIEIPDTVSAADLDRHAATVDDHTLPAGGVDFFQAILRAKFPALKKRPETSVAAPPNGLSLFVCGSLAAWLAGRGDQGAARGIPVFAMSRALFESKAGNDALADWAHDATKALREKGAALIAIGEEQLGAGLTSDVLSDRLAEAVRRVLESSPAARVLLEGGATASAVLHQLGLHRFSAQPSPGPGVGALLAVGQPGPLFLIKPGSYPWPEAVWAARKHP